MKCPSCKNTMNRKTYKYNNIKSLVYLTCPKCGAKINYEVRGLCINS